MSLNKYLLWIRENIYFIIFCLFLIMILALISQTVNHDIIEGFDTTFPKFSYTPDTSGCVQQTTAGDMKQLSTQPYKSSGSNESNKSLIYLIPENGDTNMKDLLTKMNVFNVDCTTDTIYTKEGNNNTLRYNAYGTPNNPLKFIPYSSESTTFLNSIYDIWKSLAKRAESINQIADENEKRQQIRLLSEQLPILNIFIEYGMNASNKLKITIKQNNNPDKIFKISLKEPVQFENAIIRALINLPENVGANINNYTSIKFSPSSQTDMNQKYTFELTKTINNLVKIDTINVSLGNILQPLVTQYLNNIEHISIPLPVNTDIITLVERAIKYMEPNIHKIKYRTGNNNNNNDDDDNDIKLYDSDKENKTYISGYIRYMEKNYVVFVKIDK